MKYILALDQSTISTGFSYFNDKGEFITSGLVTAKDMQDMYFVLQELIKKYKPNVIVIEDVYYCPNSAKSFHTLANLQGLIMSICYSKKIPLFIVTASDWKKSFGIKTYRTKRNEQKQQCRDIVKEKYNIDVNTDEADAIGIASWYINKSLTS